MHGQAERELSPDVLEATALVAEDVAADQQRAARQVRQIAAARRRGETWADIFDGGLPRTAIQLMAGGAATITDLAGRLRLVVVRGLAGEGHTTRQIGARFGVSHQRISSLLSRRDT